jgi:uncharacterized protein (DUF983 family)
MKWQCPKCKKVFGHYYVKVNVSCDGCGLNVASLQPYVDPAERVIRTTPGARIVDLVDAGRTITNGGPQEKREDD